MIYKINYVLKVYINKLDITDYQISVLSQNKNITLRIRSCVQLVIFHV